jgi:ATP-binding protein involved in chromosome partitioning
MSWFSALKAKFSPAQEVDEEKIQACLAQFSLPVSHALLKDRITQLSIEQHNLQLSIFVYDYEAPHLQELHDELSTQLQLAGVHNLNLHVVQKKPEENKHIPPVVDAAPTAAAAEAATQSPPTQAQLKAHPHIQHVIVIASGKGGVGKSTTTVNLALALQELGLKVGILDADIYGPSIPTMLGNEGQSPQIENEQFIPIEAYGMPILSIGHLTGDGRTPIAWRGPKATGALMQLFNQTQWPNLDVLLIDMPPGTGDIQLTLAQRIAVSGAVIVTTPQNVALLDAQKGIELFNKVNIKILGVIENMSTHICSNCGFEEQIFGSGGGDKLSKNYQIPLLGRLPLSASIREHADQGKPSVAAHHLSELFGHCH